MINLIVAVLLDKLRENQSANHSDDQYDELVESLVLIGYSKSKEKKNKTDDPLKQIGSAEFLILHELNILKNSSKTTSSLMNIFKSLIRIIKAPKITYPNGKYFKSKFVRCIYYLVNHPLFHLFIFMSIIINTVIL